MPTPVNAENVVTLDLLNLNGSVQFRVTLAGMFQWKLTASNTWYDITSLEGLRGRSVSAVTVNTQNKLVVSFDDNTSATLSLTQLEDAVARATNAATQALASAASAAAVAQGTATARPSTRPSFMLDFANSRFLDRKIPFARNSIATYFDKNGYMRTANVHKPRFAHDFLTKECLGLQMEETRTNYLLNSANFSQSNWTKQNCSVSTSTVKGIYNSFAQKVTVSGVDDPNIFQQVTLAVANNSVTFSVYLWTDETVTTKAKMYIYGASNENINSKVLDVTNVPTRFDFTVNFPSNFASSTVTFRIDPFEPETNAPVAGRYIYLDAAQMEIGSFPTSYIPTTTSTATRLADNITISGTLFTELFPSFAEGTMFINATKSPNSGVYSSYWSLSGPSTGGGQNAIRLTNLLTTGDYVNAIYNDGAAQVSQSFNTTSGNNFLNVIAWKKADSKSYNNGVAGSDNNPTTIPSNLNQFILDGVNTYIKSLAFWPRRVSNAGLAALTSTGLSGKNPMQVPAIGDLFAGAFLSPYAILREGGKETQTVDGTGASFTRNIKRPYDFTFELIDSSDATAIPSQPPTTCVAGTSYPLIFTAPVGKSITYAITPAYEY